MTEPGWVLGCFAVAMLTVSVYCFARLVAVRRLGRSLHYDVNLAHVAMGVAMAGMLSPGLRSLPDGAWEATFATFAAWFLGRSIRFARRHGFTGRSDDHLHGISHYLTHLVMACSMLYMFFVASGSPVRVGVVVSMSMGPAPGTGDYVVLPLLFVAILCASAMWHVDALARFASPKVVAAVAGGGTAPPGAGVDAPWLAPRLEMGCHIAMCVAMAFMLVLML